MIQPLNVVKVTCNLRSTKYHIFWHLRLQLGIKSTDVDLNLRVNHYLSWTLALFHLLLLLGGYYTLHFSHIFLFVINMLIKWKLEGLNLGLRSSNP